jgi:hypothetical protein
LLLAVSGLFLSVFCLGFYRPAWRPDPFLQFRPRGNASATPDYDYWVFPGDRGLHFYSKVEGRKSIKGLRAVHDLRADIEVLGHTGNSASGNRPYRIYGNIPVHLMDSNNTWADTIELKQSDVSEHSISVDVEVPSMPNDDDLWGRDARLLVSARVEYPQKVGEKDYIDRAVSYQGESRFRFARRDEKNKYELLFDAYQKEKAETDAYNDRALQVYRITKPLGALLGVGFIAAALVLWRGSNRRMTGGLPPDR